MKNTPTQLEPNVPVTRSHSMGFVILISCAAGLGGLLYGYDTAVISGAIGFLKDLYSLSPFMEGLVISSIMIGGVVGVGISGFLSDRFGRRKILMTAALLFAISAIVSALSQDVSTLIIARIIGGAGNRDGLIALCYVYYRSGTARHTRKFIFVISALYDTGYFRNILY